MTDDEKDLDLTLAQALRAALREESPVRVLMLASSLVSLYREPEFADALPPAELSFDDDVDPAHAFADVLRMFLDVDDAETTGLLHALEVLVDNDLHRARIRSELNRRRHPLPAWARQLAQARISEPVWSLTQHAGDFHY